MARIEGTQNIPSTWKTSYDGALTPLMPNSVIRSRYPWRVPAMQEGGCKVSVNQKEQRSRWKAIIDKFKTLPEAERERWYAAAPPWHSLLWYYNYFMMSGLIGNAVIGDKGGGVIKDINHYIFTMSTGANPEATINIDECDPKKTMAFFYGAGYWEVLTGVAAVIYPFMKSLNSSQLVAQCSPGIVEQVVFGVSIIEYI